MGAYPSPQPLPRPLEELDGESMILLVTLFHHGERELCHFVLSISFQSASDNNECAWYLALTPPSNRYTYYHIGESYQFLKCKI